MKIRHTIPFITALIVCILICSFSGFSADYTPFAIIGDTRIGLTETVYKKFLNTIDTQGINLIIHTGDVIDKPGNEAEWKRFLELTGNNKTLHITPGNHDINNNKSLKIYRQYIDKPPYYAFSLDDTQFIILCTELPQEISRITGKQLDWLREELKKPFQYRFVFLHKPPLPTTFGQRYGLDRYKEERDILYELLIKKKVNLVVAGHEHLYNRAAKDGITFVITGGGGAKLLTLKEEYGGFFHYIIAKRTKEGYVFTVYDMNGTIRDEFYIKNEVNNG